MLPICMKQFIRSLLLLVWLMSGAMAADSNQYDSYITEASERYGVNAQLISAVIRQESAFDPNATSSAGAQGLMQLMPGTATEMGVTDSLDPRQNILGGTRYLSQQLSTHNGNVVLALAAYNAGPGNVQRYGGVPPFEETVNYITNISGFLESSGYGVLDTSSLPTTITDGSATNPIPLINTPSLASVVSTFEGVVGIPAAGIKNGLVTALIVIMLIWLSWQVVFVFKGLNDNQFSVASSLIYLVRSLALASIFITFISN